MNKQNRLQPNKILNQSLEAKEQHTTLTNFLKKIHGFELELNSWSSVSLFVAFVVVSLCVILFWIWTLLRLGMALVGRYWLGDQVRSQLFMHVSYYTMDDIDFDYVDGE